MSPSFSPRSSGLVTWCYRQALRLYPATFRQRYEEEMLRFFRDEWAQASARGWLAQLRCVLHLAGDFSRAVPREWALRTPRLAWLTLAAAGLAARYLAVEPVPMAYKVFGYALFTCAFAMVVVAFAGDKRAAQLRLAALGLPLGLVLGVLIGLDPPRFTQPSTPVLPVSDQALTAEAIFQRMQTTYAGARSYVDDGEGQTFSFGRSGLVQRRYFHTAFVRNQGFRFEFRDQYDRLGPWKQYVVWSDGDKVHRWWTITPQLSTEKNLDQALGAAAGVSGLTSRLIPPLLDRAAGNGFLHGAPAEMTLEGRQQIDGRETYRLQLRTLPNRPITLWIDAHQYVIARISLVDRASGLMGVEDIIVYHPQLNVAVDPTALVFFPPTTSRWDLLFGGQTSLTVLAVGISLFGLILNATHRRYYRKQGRVRETWVVPLMRRLFGAHVAIAAVSLGLWASGFDFGGAVQNYLFSTLMHQGAVMVYLMHRRSRGYARFALA